MVSGMKKLKGIVNFNSTNLRLMSKKWILALSLTFILIFQCEHGITQSLTGTTGLVTIPTAEMPKDGEISFGTNWLNKKYLVLFDSNREYHGMVNFMTLGYLPFLEISLRLTRHLNFPASQAIGDRMPSVRLRLFKENEFFPSVVLGAHDFMAVFGGLGRSNNFNVLYLATSKTFRLDSFVNRIEFHLGYGTDWIKARHHQFVGLFGGVSLSPSPFIALMLEHDAEKFNCGMRISVLDHVEVLVAFLNLDTFSSGISYKFSL